MENFRVKLLLLVVHIIPKLASHFTINASLSPGVNVVMLILGVLLVNIYPWI